MELVLLQNFDRKEFREADIPILLGYAELHGLAPHHPASTLKKFLNQLITSATKVIDVHSGGKRVGAAVLLDKIQNPSNSACLEIIGLNNDRDPQRIMNFILTEVERVFPKNKSGIEVLHHKTHPFPQSLITSNGYKLHYETFDMFVKTVRYADFKLPTNFHWETVSEENFPEYYSVLTRSFAKNVETSIPPLEEMKLSYKNKKIPVLLLKDCGTAVGFLSVNIDEEQSSLGEVHTIGILPSYRGRQLGRILLNEALSVLSKNGASEFKLTVAAANRNALKLYQTFGFKITDSYMVFRKAL